MDVWKTMKGYFWWTYPRGSVHYDVMVTLILAFIFLTPLWVDFKDKPPARAERASVVIQQQGDRDLICDVDASAVSGSGDAILRRQLTEILQPITGSIQIDRYERVRGKSGHDVVRVWVHR